jgi:hypothetical protein
MTTPTHDVPAAVLAAVRSKFPLRGVMTPATVGVMTSKTTRPGIRTLLGYGVSVLPSKPTEPVRPPVDCQICSDGCHCEGGVEGVGCEHWGCWGRTATNDCPVGASALRGHMHVCAEYRKALFAYQQTSHLR